MEYTLDQFTNMLFNTIAPQVEEIADCEVSSENGTIWIAFDDKTDWKITVEKITEE